MFDIVIVLGHGAKPTLATAALARIGRHWRALYVSVLGDRDRDLFVGDQIFNRIVGPGISDFGATRVAKFFLNVFELGNDYAAQGLFVGQNLFQLSDQFDNALVFVDDLLPLER